MSKSHCLLFPLSILFPLVISVACGSGGGDETTSRTLTPTQGQRYSQPRFSPNGDAIAVQISYEEADEDVGILSDDFSDLQVLAPVNTYLGGAAWLPGGAELIYTSNDGIFQISASGGTPTQLFQGFDAFAAMQADVSPDGKRLAYGVNGGTLKTADLDGLVITDTGVSGGAPRYSPDGNSLAYVAGGAIVVADVDMESQETYEVELGFLPNIAWFPDSSALAFVGEGGISRLELSSGETTLLIDAFAAIDIDVSPDGTTIAYVQNGQAVVNLVSGF